jgi:hypothetical protein
VFPASDLLEEEGEVVVLDVLVEELLALAIDDADVPLAGGEVDSAVELGGGLAVSHLGAFRLRFPSWGHGDDARPRFSVPPKVTQKPKGLR